MLYKKLLSLLLAVVMLFSLVGCAGEAEETEEIVVPPNRFGTASGSVSGPFSLEEAVVESDAVAHIRVGNWLGNKENSICSFFEAEVVQMFSGELPTDFVLQQEGCSDLIFERYPLFTYGNELFLFLKKVNGDLPYSDVYCVFGTFPTVFYIGRDSTGTPYAVPNSANYMLDDEDLTNHALTSAATAGALPRDSVRQSLAENDPEMWGETGTIPAMYSLEELGVRIETINTLAAEEVLQ